ncbi:MAG: transposase [Collinsella sp.]
MTPSEHSSGESDRRGAITKAGNKHLRKALVEAAWHYLTCSGRPKDPARGQDPDRGARRHAAKGVRRLVERREALLARGVHGRTSPRRASSPAGCGRSASWPRRRRGAFPAHKPITPEAVVSEAVEANLRSLFCERPGRHTRAQTVGSTKKPQP